MNEDKKTPEVDVDLDLDLNIDSPPLQGASLSFFVHFLKEWCSLKQWIHPERFLRSLLKSSSSSSLPFPFFWNTLLHALSTPLLVPSSDSLPHEHWGSLLPCQENETVGFEGTRSPWVTGWTTVSHCLHATFHELLLNNHVITLETNQKKEGKEDPAPVHPHVLKSEERKVHKLFMYLDTIGTI
ncbi:hypothetical protein HMI55_001433 [Coelomomyces lativittatus]|nr:hypothetical protein HMI55_001433 [Coelomomyces lativittatus]